MPQTKTAELVSLKADQHSDTGEFTAIVAVFDTVDSMGERILPGAFAESLTAWKDRAGPIPVIWSHRWEDPDAHIGYVTDAKETAEGLEVTGRLDLADNATAARVWRLLKGRRIDNFSFAYDVIDAAEADNVTELKTLDLIEVGPTLLGANRGTHLVSAKSTAELNTRLDALASSMAEGFGAITAKLEALGATLEPDAGDAEPTPDPAPAEAPPAPTPADDPAEDADAGTVNILDAELALAELDEADDLDDLAATA